MEFFIRRYAKGMKGSGTEDVWVSSEMPSTPQFHQIAKSMGDGKYKQTESRSFCIPLFLKADPHKIG